MTNENVNPKHEGDITSLDDAINKLEHLPELGYPKKAVEYVIKHRNEATPPLLNFLNQVITDYRTLPNNFVGHLHAMFILAEFRECKAFELILKIADLPDMWPENLLGDIITEDFHRIIASVYDGNIQAIKNLIEKPAINTWSQNALLNTLLTLVKSNNLSRDYVVKYFKTLFKHSTFNNVDAMTHLVNVACDLYPEEVISEIKLAFESSLVDTMCVDLKWINRTLQLGKTNTLNEHIYNNFYYDLIDDSILEMEHWPCFSENYGKKELAMNDFYSMPQSPQISKQYISSVDGCNVSRKTKVGRNDSCPCGSGKKFKKCCLH